MKFTSTRLESEGEKQLIGLQSRIKVRRVLAAPPAMLRSASGLDLTSRCSQLDEFKQIQYKGQFHSVEAATDPYNNLHPEEMEGTWRRPPFWTQAVLLLTITTEALLAIESEHVMTVRPPRMERPTLMMTTPELISRHGYPCEEHDVVTEDGYILTLYRIPSGRAQPKPAEERAGRPAVLLQHGLVSSSDTWVLADPFNSLGKTTLSTPGRDLKPNISAIGRQVYCESDVLDHSATEAGFVLADSGYDVWLGNSRGNTYSRKHITLLPQQQQFWNFTWHEMGVWDLPASIDHILATTGQQRLFYIGHSMGCTTFFVMASTRPEYNSQIQGMVALAPGLFVKKAKSLVTKLLARYHEELWLIYTKYGWYECFVHPKQMTSLMNTFCETGSPTRHICEAIYDHTLGSFNNQTVALMYLAHLPAGTSIYTFDHFAQIRKTGKFHHYDPSVAGKINKLKHLRMPEYDLSLVTAAVAIFYGQSDMMVDSVEVLKLSKKLPNVVTVHKVADPKFNHAGFITGKNVRTLLYNHILANMMKMK
uniref:Partial AB-hydrolase lipase domain-containing protein n=1 Tax=Timema bartmani TaxID=61472 RepID=A0A7R9EV17_9NEOP|nr:unnamed protein product [Timema bartmani]